MKRRHLALALLALAACGEDRRAAAPAAAQPAARSWVAPPRLDTVGRGDGGSLIFQGRAERGARIALRDPSGAAFATSADDQGRFELRMAAPQADLLLTPEVQLGQEASPSPERLLVLAGGAGPVALVSPGAPARRLDRPGPLASVDSDGQGLLLSGAAQPHEVIMVTVDGQAFQTRADSAGRWLVSGPEAAAADVQVGGRIYAYPGPVGGSAASRAGQGWAVAWTAPDGARQWTWLPD